MCTIANGGLLYPPHIASCVCLEKKKVLLRHTYIYHTLPAFIGSQTNTQMWCKYLAVALTRTKILYKSAPTVLSWEHNGLFPFTLVQPISVWILLSSQCDSIQYDISTLLHSSVLPHYHLAVGGMDANGTEAKESWEQSAYTPQGVFFLPCISQAGCFCVRVGCCLYPTGRSVEVKEVGVWDELADPLSCCPFWLPAALSPWWELRFAELKAITVSQLKLQQFHF